LGILKEITSKVLSDYLKFRDYSRISFASNTILYAILDIKVNDVYAIGKYAFGKYYYLELFCLFRISVCSQINAAVLIRWW